METVAFANNFKIFGIFEITRSAFLICDNINSWDSPKNL